MKIPVITTDNFIIYLEETEGFTFIHCDVLVKWNKKVKNKLQKAFLALTKEWNNDLYALHVPADVKHKKFLHLFNFKFFKAIKGFDNNEYHIYIWR